MNRHKARPSCWTEAPTRTPASFPVPGVPIGCAQAQSPRHWKDTLNFTPGCNGCWRAFVSITRWSQDDRTAWMKGRQK
jgi:hypothetical protein